MVRSTVFDAAFGREAGDGRAPAAGFGRGVGEVLDEGGAGEDGADVLALDADALAVDDADAAEAKAVSLAQVLLDDGAHLARRDGVEVEDVLYLKPHRFGERVEGVNAVEVF